MHSLRFVFNLSNNTPDVPKISDIIDPSRGYPIDILQVFTYAWIWFLGGWFIAAIVGVLAAAAYLKSENAMYPVVLLIIMVVIFGGVMRATPFFSGYPDAAVFVDIVGILCAFAVGFLVYRVFIEYKG